MSAEEVHKMKPVWIGIAIIGIITLLIYVKNTYLNNKYPENKGTKFVFENPKGPLSPRVLLKLVKNNINSEIVYVRVIKQTLTDNIWRIEIEYYFSR